MTGILIFYYSMYGRTETMANAVASGARTIEGVEVEIWRVPELLLEEAALKAGAKLDQAAPITVVDELADYGMIIVRIPYSCQELMILNEMTGGSPYGAGTIAAGDGRRLPSENELAIARFRGSHVANSALKPASWRSS
jgi:multimeric flavodoxin WrbA